MNTMHEPVPGEPAIHRCPICSEPSSYYCRKEPADYFKCRRCATMFQSPLPTIEQMRNYVDKEYSAGVYREYVRAADLKRLTFRDRARAIKKRYGTGRLLDVGASCGYFIDAALDEGFDAYGVELSPEAVRSASGRARERLTVGDVNQLIAKSTEPFDIITAFDIVEHTLDPHRFLQNLVSVSHAGTALVMSTPDTRHFISRIMRHSWPMLQPHQHTVLFSRESLRTLLEKCQFYDIEIISAFKVLTPDYLAGQISVHNPLLTKMYGVIRSVLPPGARNAQVRVNISEIMSFSRVRTAESA